MILTAPAKLNLRLLVGPRRPDGYHDVRSLMVALDGLADTVSLVPAPMRSVAAQEAPGPQNLAWRALEVLERHVGRDLPCAVEITKRIPARAGLGGGSSDAAATILAANQVFDLGLDDDAMERVAAEVGSDVPFFIRGGAQWAEGRGERLSPGSSPEFVAVIVAPDVGLATPEVYAAFDRLPPPASDDRVPPPARLPALAAWVRNDLWPAACALRPELVDVDRALRAAGAEATLLCGSGSAMAGLFASATEAADGLRVPGALAVVRPSRV